MPGAVDVNGVYQYAEDDLLSPFSSFMALGQNAASALAARAPRGVLPNGYVALTANSTVGATTTIATTPVDVPGLSCAVTVGTGRRLKLTYDGMLFSSVAGDRAQVGIREGSTLITSMTMTTAATGTIGLGAHVEAVITPTPGAHTYKISIGRGSGTGAINVASQSINPAFLLVEDIGSSS